MKSISLKAILSLSLIALVQGNNNARESQFISWDNPPADLTFHRGSNLHFHSNDGKEHTIVLVQGPNGFNFENGKLNSENPNFIASNLSDGEYVFKDTTNDRKMTVRIADLYDTAIRQEIFKLNDQNGGEFLSDADKAKAEEQRKKAEELGVKGDIYENNNANKQQEVQNNPQNVNNDKPNQNNLNDDKAPKAAEQKVDTKAAVPKVDTKAATPKVDTKAATPKVDTKASTPSPKASSDSKASPAAVETVATQAPVEENISSSLRASVTMVVTVCALSIAYLL